jgi:carbon storage regulator
MLVLSRKAGEEIVMSNGDIRISVLGITGKRVRLGISAPSGIPVHRMEIHHRISQAIKSEAEPEEDSAGIL